MVWLCLGRGGDRSDPGRPDRGGLAGPLPPVLIGRRPGRADEPSTGGQATASTARNRVKLGIVRSLARPTKKDVAEVGLDLGFFRGALWVDHEVGPPLSSLSAASATVDEVFVEGDHVARLRVDSFARAGRTGLA
jgi:hypothetical protein